MLYGRQAELDALHELLAAVRAGAGAGLVLRGEAGIGKTALLDALAATDGVRVLRAAGVESEVELPFAGLHLLLRPVLDRVGTLPEVQATALRGALGLAAGNGTDSDGFLVGLAALSLLAELAADRPLLVLVDDAQWLDRASAAALLFAARRLDADSVGMIFATRDVPDFPTPGLPELRLAGLADDAAGELLDAGGTGLDPVRRDRVLAAAAGNPLALLELPGALGDAADHGALPLTDRLRAAFRARLAGLTDGVRDLLLVAALDGTGELPVLLRAAARFGAGTGTGTGELDTAVRAGLLTVLDPDDRVAFRHPLVRATVAQDAPPGRRIAAHTALAAAWDTPGGADRRAWHLAAAATAPDEQIAVALTEAAARAAGRHGHAAEAAAYARAAELSEAADARLRRLTLAAEAAAEAGELDRSARLAADATAALAGTSPAGAEGRPATGEPSAGTDPSPVDDVDVRRAGGADPRLAARLLSVRAAASFWRGSLGTAHRAYLRAADLLAPIDAGASTALLVEAVHVGWYTGERELAEAYDRLATALGSDPGTPNAGDCEATAMARLTLLGVGPAIGRATPTEPSPDEAMATVRRLVARPGWQIMTAAVGIVLGQDGSTIDIGAEEVAQAHRHGRIGRLPQALFYLASGRAYAGWHEAAARDAATGVELAHATDQRQWAGRLREPLAHLAAVAGDEARVHRLVDDARADAAASDPDWDVPWVHSSLGLVELSLGRAEPALAELSALAAQRALFHIPAIRSVPDLVEAAVRAGRPDAAADALHQYRRWAAHTGQGWVAALVLRCEALLADDATAEQKYEAALAGSRRANRPFETARTALLYGEWLRRLRRRTEAREHLQAAVRAFDRLAAPPWAQRARAELAAAGQASEQAPTDTLAVLTPQERQIVLLAARGLSNKDIAGRLFLSPRTVGYHLYKAYPKLGVLSRGELPAVVGGS
ncbi:helix-turn-helix transcriptional regulator [Actinocatenispora sera]|uniref:Helix-turn-helix transcriptional regulator n=1 Tax=Actinocatenispora sera TaxID=390989 RepID=A0A810L9I8_9ACTN|nr:helix-turn-helix transcriptional regulator [Actinocatenispora sera]BCJ32230.1 helix-turn-helix transcriptional regulator [Actinocatenispora sera]